MLINKNGRCVTFPYRHRYSYNNPNHCIIFIYACWFAIFSFLAVNSFKAIFSNKFQLVLIIGDYFFKLQYFQWKSLLIIAISFNQTIFFLQLHLHFPSNISTYLTRNFKYFFQFAILYKRYSIILTEWACIYAVHRARCTVHNA